MLKSYLVKLKHVCKSLQDWVRPDHQAKTRYKISSFSTFKIELGSLCNERPNPSGGNSSYFTKFAASRERKTIFLVF